MYVLKNTLGYCGSIYLSHFPDSTHIKVNNGRKSAFMNLLKLNFYGYIGP